MATFREIVYTVLDEIKSINNDSYITEDHVIFLANQYRLFIIQQKIEKQGEQSLSSSNEQTICVDLEPDNEDECGELYLKSVQEIPHTISGTTPKVFVSDYFNTKIAYVTKDRMKFVGYNKYLKNITYCCLRDDHVYLKSNNPQFAYLEKAKLTGIFEDAAKAAELSCDGNGEGECPDVLDAEFPMSGDLTVAMISLLVKELTNALHSPADTVNNSADDIADIVYYVRKNMKSNITKQLEQ